MYLYLLNWIQKHIHVRFLFCVSLFSVDMACKIIIIFISYKAQYPNILKALYNKIKKLFSMC